MPQESAAKDSKAQILTEFRQLLAERSKIESKVATKEEEAEKEKNKELLAVASTYTIDSIVKGLADLQLDFGTIVQSLAEKVETESEKLEQLRRAIAIEGDRLEELRKVRVVADALHILTQEHREKLANLEKTATEQQEAIEKEMASERKAWEKEQAEFEARAQEQQELRLQARQQEEADYQYKIERLRKVEMDEYEELKRVQERELQGADAQKQKDWSERERELDRHQAEYAQNLQKIEGFEEELKQAYTKAKEEAIAEARREAKVKADLFEKEWEGTKEGYELTIQSLENTIERQTAEIADITAQLQAAMRQAQDLAMRAFQNTDRGDRASTSGNK
ncbi:hypothetical protein [Oxynema aestuarii]|jgi:DNA repair exonuclease SbcCD ATPase subunit|uniref:Uncharacterized protein n=1 Tax=Oxynema aestuarii AP17 TaxID=2064643 RepID=A0A6H1TUP8_9CYAN|nr:hypothetical protein [Oxynema aestuarii]QIZ69483.1 hypothetical protein HCG48_01845 [Oxynema aestuarii AP17]RMH73899.1 MAG: hypothetical protein D6680_15915 [Cyanobacteria bacterium J007]